MSIVSNLVERGNTVIIIEHHMDVISNAHWIIDMGPEGGDEGGKIVAKGTPKDLANHPTSHTARYLRKYLKKINVQINETV